MKRRGQLTFLKHTKFLRINGFLNSKGNHIVDISCKKVHTIGYDQLQRVLNEI